MVSLGFEDELGFDYVEMNSEYIYKYGGRLNRNRNGDVIKIICVQTNLQFMWDFTL